MFVNAFADEAGRTIRAPFSPSWPLEMLNELTLAEDGARTMLTLRVRPLDAPVAEAHTFRDGFDAMRQGFGGTFDRLADYLAAAAPPERGNR